MAVHGTDDCLSEAQVIQKAQWPIWESIRLIILGPGFNFGQWLKVLANLTNLANLFSRNLGKTPMSGHLTTTSQVTDRIFKLTLIHT